MKKDLVWAIFKISYDPFTGQAAGCVCGSVFFVKKQVFISANHCFNDTVFIPNNGYPKVKVFLVNDRGYIINNVRIKKLVPKYDLAIGEIINYDKNVNTCSITVNFDIGDLVYNIGFPSDRSLVDYKIKIENNQLIFEKITLEKFQQDGRIEGVIRVTVNASDVKLNDKPMIKLSYSSTEGFSGGPLLLKSSGKAIGMMSLVVPSNVDPERPVMAIKMSDVLKFMVTD